MVILAIALIVALTRRSSRLRPLPAESRDRFARTWSNIESRFIEDPRAAVQEADRAVVLILSERGATMPDGRDVPEDLQQAREAASSDGGRQETESMRKAMVHYKHIVDDAIGTAKETREASHREVAS
ncbi:MAG: hypothetical protein AUI87_04660 [Actinobacteria bacterium 13_1_40CM_3_66_19]|nr:MAG: hypothetical protein AUI87_04660 [Actinobacteria bacterium 13_1_40CM_3_66_19]